MAGVFGVAIQAAKTGEVFEETAAQVAEAMNKVDDANTSGLSKYSRLADAAEALINEYTGGQNYEKIIGIVVGVRDGAFSSKNIYQQYHSTLHIDYFAAVLKDDLFRFVINSRNTYSFTI